MRTGTEKKYAEWGHGGRPKGVFRRVLALLLAFEMILNPLEITSLPAYAADNNTVTFKIGEKAAAVLADGVLTLEGEGASYDYNAGETPFLPYADSIQTLVIGSGITYIGAHLFYGLGSLGGEVILPGSIVGFGEGAFAGDSLETAPKFTVIRNEFESAEITHQEVQDTTPQQEEMNPGEPQTEEPEVIPEPEAVPEDKVQDEARAEEKTVDQGKAEGEVSAEEAPEGAVSTEDVPSDGAAEAVQPDLVSEVITQQEIADPDGLFFAGQTGSVYASDGNTSFIQSAQSAGYMRADGSIMVTIDDATELEVPTMNGQFSLPECPEEIVSAHTGDALFDYTFEGWNQGQLDPAAPVLAAGSLLEIQEEQSIRLYSVWSTTAKYQLQVTTKRENDTVTYTLMDAGTGEQADGVEGYDFQYQWQMAMQTDGDIKEWTDIEGANGVVYDRTVESADAEKLFRCAVTAVKQTKSRAAEEPVMLYSDEVSGVAAEVQVVYVDQANGNDTTGEGTEGKPYKTIEKAGEFLKKKEDGGAVENNKIIIKGTYTLGSEDLLKNAQVPVTITGGTFVGKADGSDTTIELNGDICFNNITLGDGQHIYGNGYNITIGENVKGSNLYLYGGRKGDLTGISPGKITVLSGSFARIVGTVRSRTETDVQMNEININVGGNANVTRVVVGSASGIVKNAKAVINITGGTVDKMVGGNQGFQNTKSSFEGDVTINVSGGTVKNLLGGGEGRHVSVPDYLGQMKINVSGGTVNNIYGAGSAAYVISNDAVRSNIDITVTGGTVGNIYGAGSGGDSMVNFKETYKEFEPGTSPSNFGSVTGDVAINIQDNARITGNVYASGEGYYSTEYDTTKNAYLNGNAVIKIAGGTVEGNVYGGGKGSTNLNYEQCARVTENSVTKVLIEGGTIKGKVFGGGENGLVKSNTSVSISGGTINGNVYGGGESGLVEKRTEVNLSGGTIYGSLYGGALGKTKERLVYGGSTVNMTGGWVQHNLYGGSELSNDGPEENGTPVDKLADIGFVNLAGGTVSGNVFGGGYQGIVNGSTHLHIGKHALAECNYYQHNPDDIPKLDVSASLVVGGSVYAGGDYGGGDTIDYTTITVKGTSHVYIDGTEYDTGSDNGKVNMTLSGGAFGSGASCDAGSTRLVTLRNYGQLMKDSTGLINDASRKLTAIQRADKVTLINSHVHLTGQSDVANSNQTAKYSLNRIGDHEGNSLGEADRGLVLQGGSTLVLDSAGIETSSLKNVDDSGDEVTLENVEKTPNTIRFNTGTVLRFAYTQSDGTEHYGAVSGYAYMSAADTADAYIYARQKEEAGVNKDDGGFKSPLSKDGKEIKYTNVPDTKYRYWQASGKNANADRHTVLTAQTLAAGDPGYGADKFSTATGTIELPPSEAGVNYTIKSVTLPSGLTLADAAKNGSGEWKTSEINSDSGSSVDMQSQMDAIQKSPLDTFGLFMNIGDGFKNVTTAPGKIISNTTSTAGATNTIIGKTTSSSTDGSIPKINFCLTYWNDGITASKDLGTIQMVLTSSKEAQITMSINIVTKASTLTDQTVDLYATQSGSYAGKVIIPSGYSRQLKLTGVNKGTSGLVSASESLSDYKFSVGMQTISSQGWSSMGEMKNSYDLAGYSQAITIGNTDSRYQAEIEFTLKNSPGFTAKDAQDEVVLTIKDETENTESKILLNIHWKDSIVSGVSVERGRRYGGSSVSQTACAITPRSAATAVFTLGSQAGSDSLWLELRNETTQSIAKIPTGTKFTFMEYSKFYYYEADGSTDRISINDFIDMSTETKHVSSTLSQGMNLNVIMDFGAATETLPANRYSLRLRSDTGADSKGAEFTVDSSQECALNISGGNGTSRGIHQFELSADAKLDTRLMDGMAVVLSPEDGSLFPAGTVFTYNEQKYYPGGGKVCIPLSGDTVHLIKMDTTNTMGLTTGQKTLKAELFPTGRSAGAKTDPVQTAAVKYAVTEDLSYSLQVALQGEDRIVEKGGEYTFTVTYEIPASEINKHSIGVSVQKKASGTYTGISNWTVSGNTQISAQNSQQNIQVSIPSEMDAGTYRLIFDLEGQKVPYNIIVK